MSNQEAVDIALKIKNPQKAAKQLSVEALRRDSKDDISCIVVQFKGWLWLLFFPEEALHVHLSGFPLRRGQYLDNTSLKFTQKSGVLIEMIMGTVLMIPFPSSHYVIYRPLLLVFVSMLDH